MSNHNTDDNPWADPARDNLRPTQNQNQPTYNSQQTSNNPFYQQSNSPNPWQLGQNQGQESSYTPPPGPPPSQSQTQWSQQSEQQSNPYAQQQSYHQPQQQQSYHQPTPGITKSSTFNETDFIPASERGEQREAMEQFEISNSKPQSTDDRNVETLQQEFPGLDGSLVAAIYMDSKQMGAVREMLGELSGK
jgi:hypothetical protein